VYGNAELTKVLKKIDNLIETKKDTNTDFYNNYKAVRRINDNKGGGKKGDEPPTPPAP
jgi:hypothetical protein